MKHLRTPLTAAICCLAGAALAAAQTPAPAAAPAANPLIEPVRTAPDASSTIEAYSRGLAAGLASPVELRQAYVRHMAELGAPELAYMQAQDLINRGAADATINGIAAYNDAARGDARAAVSHLKLALAERPADPFLLRTAGQVVAWYDAQADRNRLSPADVTGIEWLRASGQGRQEFTESYRAAMEARRQSQAGANSTGVEPAPPAPPTSQPSYGDGRSGTSSGSSGSSAYDSNPSRTTSSSDPYSYNYPYSYSYYPYYAYGDSAAAASLLVLRDRDFHPQHPLFDRRGSPERPGGAAKPPLPAAAPRTPPVPPPQPKAPPVQPSAPPRAPAAAPRPPSPPRLPPGPPHP